MSQRLAGLIENASPLGLRFREMRGASFMNDSTICLLHQVRQRSRPPARVPSLSACWLPTGAPEFVSPAVHRQS